MICAFQNPTIWNMNSDDNNNNSDNEVSQSQEINFTLMDMVKDISSGMDIETIIATNNIIDFITIELLRKIIESKKFRTQSSTMMCSQASTSTPFKQPHPSSHKNVINIRYY
jgi:hypothetical protein